MATAVRHARMKRRARTRRHARMKRRARTKRHATTKRNWPTRQPLRRLPTPPLRPPARNWNAAQTNPTAYNLPRRPYEIHPKLWKTKNFFKMRVNTEAAYPLLPGRRSNRRRRPAPICVGVLPCGWHDRTIPAGEHPGRLISAIAFARYGSADGTVRRLEHANAAEPGIDPTCVRR